MSSGNDGNTQDPSESKMQALSALVSSLSDEAGKEKIATAELTKKLDNILGEGVGERATKAEILNEEGLPIIDITEPAEQPSSLNRVAESYTADDDPIPLTILSPQERLRRQAERNRILDLLEEEEEREAAKEAEGDDRDFVVRAKVDARAETERKRAAREMQKKMGKALVASLASSRTSDANPASSGSRPDDSAKSFSGNAGNAKKTVTFNDDATTRLDATLSSTKQGDVSLAPLRTSSSSIKPKSANVDGLPLKMNVVERVHQKKPVIPARTGRVVDSDDESVGEISDAEIPSLSSINDHSDDDENAASDPLDGSDDDIDLSQAQLQREAALEYFRLRESMGVDLAQVLASSSKDGEDPWNRPEVPLEATLASRPPKPSVSRFKASRRAVKGTGSGSVSVAGFAMPQADVQTLGRAIRKGKLEADKLVGGDEGESASEDETSGRERKRKIELLKRGDPTEIAAAFQGPYNVVVDPNEHPSQANVDAVIANPPPTAISSKRVDNETHASSLGGKEDVPITRRSTASFHNPPTAIPIPHVPPSVRTAKDVSSQPKATNSSVLPSPPFPPGAVTGPPSLPPMVIESPSFPRRNPGQIKTNATSVMSDVVERTKVPAVHSQNETTPRSKPKVSMFKSERS